MTKRQIVKIFDRIQQICLALPEAKEVEDWGHATFRAPKKIFAAYGARQDGSAALGRRGWIARHEELLADPRFCPAPYSAHRRWVSLQLQPKMEWAEVTTLVTEAYRQVAHKRLVKILDER